MNFYIFRHAHNQFSINGIPYPPQDFDVGILKEHTGPYKEMAQYLNGEKVEKYYTSEYLRCVQTMQIIKDKIGIEYEKEHLLNEIYLDKFNEAKQRIIEFVEKTGERYDSIAICTHAGIIQGLKSIVTKDDFDVHDIPGMPDPGVLTVIRDKQIEEIDFN